MGGPRDPSTCKSTDEGNNAGSRRALGDLWQLHFDQQFSYLGGQVGDWLITEIATRAGERVTSGGNGGRHQYLREARVKRVEESQADLLNSRGPLDKLRSSTEDVRSWPRTSASAEKWRGKFEIVFFLRAQEQPKALITFSLLMCSLATEAEGSKKNATPAERVDRMLNGKPRAQMLGLANASQGSTGSTNALRERMLIVVDDEQGEEVSAQAICCVEFFPGSNSRNLRCPSVRCGQCSV